jgi:hypothetical protein
MRTSRCFGFRTVGFIAGGGINSVWRSSSRVDRNTLPPATACTVSLSLIDRKCRLSTQPACTTTNTKRSDVVRVGILRETYNLWERRAPLTPHHVHQLLKEYNDGNCAELDDSSNGCNNNRMSTKNVRVQVLVQPSTLRIFPDSSYAQAGAIIQNDLSDCHILLGIKRPIISSSSSSSSSSTHLYPNKTYAFFSHTIKGQFPNMDLLRQILYHRVQLLDYECVYEPIIEPATIPSNEALSPIMPPQHSKRMISFGPFAGRAGVIDTLHALGRRLLYRKNNGFNTPFLGKLYF